MEIKIESFIDRVLKKYNLTDWKVKFWDIKGENECHIDLKRIYLYSYKDIRKLKTIFLHEVAHALLPNDLYNSHHRRDWQDMFIKLINEDWN